MQAPSLNQALSLAPKLNEIVNTLQARFVGRDKEAYAVVLALASGEPLYWEAAPGTGKTAMVETLARLVNGQYFYYQAHEYAEPDEVLGPIDVVALREKGVYTRRTEGYLPTANIVFVDEIYRASGAFLNMLLDIVLNKRVKLGSEVRKLKLAAIYFAANFRRQEEEFAAFHDRLVIRLFSEYLPNEKATIERLIDAGLDILANSEVEPMMSIDEVLAFQATVKRHAKAIIAPVKSKLAEAVIELRNAGIPFSDRRIVKLAYVTAVVAVLGGGDVAAPDDVATALRLVAPLEPSDAEKVEQVIQKLGLDTLASAKQEIESLIAEGRNLASKILEVNIKLMRGEAKPDDVAAEISGIPEALQNIAIRLAQVLEKAASNKRLAKYLASRKASIEEALDDIQEALRVAEKLKKKLGL